MTLKGTVRYINHQRGMVAALTEEGSYSVFELLGGDAIEIGDSLSWQNDTSLGSETINNHTQSERYEVYFQNHHILESQLRRQLLV